MSPVSRSPGRSPVISASGRSSFNNSFTTLPSEDGFGRQGSASREGSASPFRDGFVRSDSGGIMVFPRTSAGGQGQGQGLGDDSADPLGVSVVPPFKASEGGGFSRT
jgi:hypothetical protein